MGSWHPKENTFAVAKHNSLFLYTAKRENNSHNRQSRTSHQSRRGGHQEGGAGGGSNPIAGLPVSF